MAQQIRSTGNWVGSHGSWRLHSYAEIQQLTDNRALVAVHLWRKNNNWGFNSNSRFRIDVKFDGTWEPEKSWYMAAHNASYQEQYAGTFAKWVDRTPEGFYIALESWMKAESGTSKTGVSSVTSKIWIPAKAVVAPSAPKILNVERTSAGTAKITLDIVSEVATRLVVERQSSDTGTWTSIYDGNTTSTVLDSSKDKFRYRAKNVNKDGESIWSNVSDWLEKLGAPFAPSLVAPASGEYISTTGKSSIELKWRHNPKDGTAQAQAEIRVQSTSNSSISREYQVTGTTQSYSITPRPGTISWSVRTKGLSSEWSAWSAMSSFNYVAPARITISPIGEIHALPFDIRWTTEDSQGHFVSGTAELINTQGTTVYKAQITQAGQLTIPKEARLVNGERYTLTLTILSSTSISSRVTTSFTVKYNPPELPGAEVVINEDEGSATIYANPTPGEVVCDSLAVFRDDVLLAENVLDTGLVLDSTPPLDTPLTYRVVATASNGASCSRDITVSIPSNSYVYINYGGKFQQVVRARFNLQVSSEHQNETAKFTTPNRTFDVAMFGIHKKRKGTISADVCWLEDLGDATYNGMLDAWVTYANYTGLSMIRLPQNECFYAVCDVSVRRGNTYNIAPLMVDYEEVSHE